MKNILALILAGGRGTRMDILGYYRPKSVLPFAGHHRIIDFSINNCLLSGITNIAILVDHQREQLLKDLQQTGILDSNHCGIQILEPKAESYKGTADAVYQNLAFIQNYDADTIMVLAADHVYRMDYRQILAFHNQSSSEVTISATSVPIEQAYRFGIINANYRGQITEFFEKPLAATSNLASMGLYVFNRQPLIDCLIEDAANAASTHDFGCSIIPMLIKRGKAFVYTFEDYWRDIGTLEAYYSANMEQISDTLYSSLNKDWHLKAIDSDLPHSQITSTAIVNNSRINRGCIIKGEVTNSVLSAGVIVEEHSVVNNSIVMAGTVIGNNSMVDRCILDEKVDVGAFCHLGIWSDFAAAEDNITILGRGVKIPSYTNVVCGCKITTDDAVTNLRIKKSFCRTIT